MFNKKMKICFRKKNFTKNICFNENLIENTFSESVAVRRRFNVDAGKALNFSSKLISELYRLFLASR